MLTSFTFVPEATPLRNALRGSLTRKSASGNSKPRRCSASCNVPSISPAKATVTYFFCSTPSKASSLPSYATLAGDIGAEPVGATDQDAPLMEDRQRLPAGVRVLADGPDLERELR